MKRNRWQKKSWWERDWSWRTEGTWQEIEQWPVHGWFKCFQWTWKGNSDTDLTTTNLVCKMDRWFKQQFICDGRNDENSSPWLDEISDDVESDEIQNVPNDSFQVVVLVIPISWSIHHGCWCRWHDNTCKWSRRMSLWPQETRIVTKRY